MWKLFKSRKALSPVVAAIILIAVTVAVSIAVAAWMGALTFTFMNKPNPKVISHTWTTSGITLNVKNAGTADMTWDYVEVNSVKFTNATWTPTTGILKAGDSGTVVISWSYRSGTPYNFAVYTKSGENAVWTATAP